jgi:hypothetical protein
MAIIEDRIAPVQLTVEHSNASESHHPVRLCFGTRVLHLARDEARRLANDLERAAADSFEGS